MEKLLITRWQQWYRLIHRKELISWRPGDHYRQKKEAVDKAASELGAIVIAQIDQHRDIGLTGPKVSAAIRQN